ncbi:AGE family epimerase/isomerase [Rhizobium halophytocola]|uniref:Mannose/cellobiose epimerase-like protein (N-acyl-D-glucosamine 2-epimerase family) n=1 Tax=Rhizobium halophytocola TaxID=735519 RepID=A0ABS4E379_9HYPH|nr:mannose/cellobiose epimerase-like protein (N-acyl-D-glucosamine 2-epimerase family) [Rhizobium halophytocola]
MNANPALETETLAEHWSDRPYHRHWLLQRADDLFDFFEADIINPKGGFFELNLDGTVPGKTNPVRGIHVTCRMIHCFAIAHLLGRPGAMAIVEHGMDFLWNRHRDTEHGGYFWQVDDNGPVDASKQGYGHAFVLLAASSARAVGHPLADAMLADITDVINTRFWDEAHGAIAEEFERDWSAKDGGNYRGQNCNMHLTEALMAAFEATGDQAYLSKAERIADLLIRRKSAELNWRVPEHFDTGWTVDQAYDGDQMFRPSGSTPGHWLEWARLVLQLWTLGGKTHDWMPEAAKGLFFQAMALGWDRDNGGFVYTIGWDNIVSRPFKLWWPMAEGAGAAHFLNQHQPSDFHEDSYRRIWGTISRHFLDRKNGGWHQQLSQTMQPEAELFPTRDDIYHALQACLIPLFPADGSVLEMIRTNGDRP